MAARRVADQQTSLRIQHESLAGEVSDAHAECAQRHRHEGNAMQKLQERQLKNIEADIASENRIGGAERHRVAGHQPQFPFSGGVQGDQH